MFKFRLQRVLELREKREEARAIELSKAQDDALRAREQRDELQAMHQASRAQITSAQHSDPTVGHLHHLGFVLGALDQRLAQAAQIVTKAEDVVSEKRVSLEEAARDRRVLDRLKEKHTDVFRAEESQRDRIAMDEIALTRFARIRDAVLQAKAQKQADSQAQNRAPQHTQTNQNDNAASNELVTSSSTTDGASQA